MLEKQLIDANTAASEFERFATENPGAYLSAFGIADILRSFPTVDAVEVVRGRWIEDQVEGFSPFGGDSYLLDVLQCSVCGEYFDVSEARNYCPNCGAKMDGDGDG